MELDLVTVCLVLVATNVLLVIAIVWPSKKDLKGILYRLDADLIERREFGFPQSEIDRICDTLERRAKNRIIQATCDDAERIAQR